MTIGVTIAASGVDFVCLFVVAVVVDAAVVVAMADVGVVVVAGDVVPPTEVDVVVAVEDEFWDDSPLS